MGLNTTFVAVAGRRLLVALVTLVSSMAVYAGGTDQLNLAHLPDKLSETERYQLLYRTTFGPTESTYNQLQKLGYKEWLQRQLSLSASSHEKLFLSFDEPESHKARGNAWWQIVIYREDQLRQRMAFALSEIFVVSRLGGGLGKKAHSLSNYYDLLAENAFLNYRQLLEKVTFHPAMGRYLSMMGSRKADTDKGTFPDENYAREVMQLFTIGLYQLNSNGSYKKDNNGNRLPSYTQQDVEEVARAFSGWVREKSDKALLKPMRAVSSRHDFTEKRVLGHTLKSGQTPYQDVSQVLDILFYHPNTPVFISKQLIKRFVTSNPSDEYVQRVSSVFADNGKGERGDLKSLLLAILLDQEALGYTEFKPVKVKEPLLALTNIYRTFSVGGSESEAKATLFYRAAQQGPLSSPSVFNFFEPDYQPASFMQQGEMVAPELELMNWTSYTAYSNAARAILYSVKKADSPLSVDEYTDLKNQPEQLIELINKRLFANKMSAELKSIIKDNLSGNSKRKQNQVLQSLYLALISDEFLIQE